MTLQQGGIVLIMHQISEYKFMLFVILSIILCIILFCCFRCYIVPSWRERNNRIKPAESIILVNPMRIKHEKIMRVI